MAQEVISTSHFRISGNDDGIVELTWLPNVHVDLAVAEQTLDVMDRLGGGKHRYALLVDSRALASMDRHARHFYQRAEGPLAVALLISSPLTRMIATFFMGLNQPALPIKLFTSEPEARAWLRGFLAEQAE